MVTFNRIVILAVLLTGCANPNPELTFMPSKKSAVQLRAAQTRLIPGAADSVMRGVITTLHDLGYRITKAEPGARTVSATRRTTLRMAVVVQPRSEDVSIVRANATIVALHEEAQVDSPEFYNLNFFVPLGATLHRTLTEVPDDVVSPEPIRPVAEINSAKARQATAGSPPASGSSAVPPRSQQP